MRYLPSGVSKQGVVYENHRFIVATPLPTMARDALDARVLCDKGECQHAEIREKRHFVSGVVAKHLLVSSPGRCNGRNHTSAFIPMRGDAEVFQRTGKHIAGRVMMPAMDFT
jgi:hypothetical protein